MNNEHGWTWRLTRGIGPSSAWSHLAGLVAALLLIGGCTAPPPGPSSVAAPGVQYAFVLVGPEGQAVARAITTAPECPAIELDGRFAPMDERVAPVSLLPRAGIEHWDGKPASFP